MDFDLELDFIPKMILCQIWLSCWRYVHPNFNFICPLKMWLTLIRSSTPYSWHTILLLPPSKFPLFASTYGSVGTKSRSVAFNPTSELTKLKTATLDSSFRLASWGTIIFLALFYISCQAASLAQCTPIQGNWDLTGETHKKCFNTEVYFYGEQPHTSNLVLRKTNISFKLLPQWTS